MMYVMCGFPPVHVNAREEVSDEDADDFVFGEAAGDGAMACVVAGKGDVLEVEADEHGSCSEAGKA